MALVPFPVNSPGVPPPASTGRGPGVGRPQVAGAQNASRAPQGVAAADGRPANAPAAKGKSAFAQVLAAARAEEKPTVDEAATRPGKGRLVGGETDASVTTRETHEPEDAPTVVAAQTQDDSRAVPASSWLLLALGQRPLVSSDHDTAVVSPEDQPTSGDDVVAPVDPAAGNVTIVVPVAGPVVAAPPVATPAYAAVGPASADAGSAAFVSGSEIDSLAAFTAPAFVATAASGRVAVGEDPWLPADGAEAALEAVGVPAVNAESSVDAAASFGAVPTMSKEQEASAASVTATQESSTRPAADAVARWRAAARALGGAVRPRVTPTETATPEGAAVAGPNVVDGAAAVLAGRGPGAANAAPSAAVQELTKLVNSLAEPTGEKAQQIGIKAQLPLVEAGAAEGAVTPGVRASDVLMRLAQAGAELNPAPRVVRADLPDASVFGQMMASAAPVSTPPTHVATPAAAAPALPPAVGEQVNAHIVSSLKMQWKDGIGEAKLHLRPDAYGAVTVALKVEQGAVTAVVRSDNPQVQEWVLQHQQTLRQQMEAAGLHLEELTVSPDDQGQQRQDQEAQPQSRRRSRRAGTTDEADGPVFELLA